MTDFNTLGLDIDPETAALLHNMELLTENPTHGWRIRLGNACARHGLWMDWLDEQGITAFWTDDRPPIAVPDSWLDECADLDADPDAAAIVVSAALVDRRFVRWEEPDELQPTDDAGGIA